MAEPSYFLVDRTAPLRGSVLSKLIIKRHTPKQADLCVRGPSASSFQVTRPSWSSAIGWSEGGRSGFATQNSVVDRFALRENPPFNGSPFMFWCIQIDTFSTEFHIENSGLRREYVPFETN